MASDISFDLYLPEMKTHHISQTHLISVYLHVYYVESIYSVD